MTQIHEQLDNDASRMTSWWTVHFKALEMVNFMVCVFYHSSFQMSWKLLNSCSIWPLGEIWLCYLLLLLWYLLIPQFLGPEGASYLITLSSPRPQPVWLISGPWPWFFSGLGSVLSTLLLNVFPGNSQTTPCLPFHFHLCPQTIALLRARDLDFSSLVDPLLGCSGSTSNSACPKPNSAFLSLPNLLILHRSLLHCLPLLLWEGSRSSP